MKSVRAHLERVSLRTWWLENRLRGIDGKLRRLRFAQKRIRDRAAELIDAKWAGLSAEEFEMEEAALDAKRERLAHEISRFVAKEHRLKDELRRLGVSLASH